MIIIENIVFSLQRIGGISAVWKELISRLANDKELEVKFIEYAGADKNVLRKELEIPCSSLKIKHSGLIRLKRFTDIRLNYNHPFIFHSSDYRVTNNRHAVNFVTVHDFIYFLANPSGLLRKAVKWIHCYQMRHAIRKAEYLICISRNTMNDLIKFVPGIDIERISIIYNGASDDYFPLTDINSAKLPFEPYTYVLFVGSRSKYKNFELAVKSISQTGLSLVIVGKRLDDNEASFAGKYFKEKKLKCYTDIDNATLNTIYNGAYCLLYPSSYEGFGIPVIEAQKAGCPVIAANASSIPEIIGDTPLVLNELTEGEIIKYIDLLKDYKQRQEIIRNGIINAEKYSWDRTYSQVKELYQKAFEKMRV
jgi:glycosyltransferase involved in cell wall biosynthesis